MSNVKSCEWANNYFTKAYKGHLICVVKYPQNRYVYQKNITKVNKNVHYYVDFEKQEPFLIDLTKY